MTPYKGGLDSKVETTGKDSVHPRHQGGQAAEEHAQDGKFSSAS